MTSSPKKIIVYGNRIDGTIAAVKRLVSARNQFLTTLGKSNANYLDDYDTLAISVFDLMHRNESVSDYDKDTQEFKDIVQNILNDNNYEISIKTVKTTNDNTTLRLKNLNSDFSPLFKDAVVNNSIPVVLQGGIFSNLFTLELGIGEDLVKKGYNVWTTEQTGGPATECDTCPNYTYQDLVDYYWPALIAAVMEYSGKNQINYIGHSNGCRVAFSSLDNYSYLGKNHAGNCFNFATGQYDIECDLPSLPVNKIFGIACPTTLNDETMFVEAARRQNNGQNAGNIAIANLNSSGLTHVTKRDYAKLTNPVLGSIFVFGGSTISLNLMSFYNSLAININSISPGNTTNVSEVHLLFGVKDFDPRKPNGVDDGIVHISDLYTLNNSLSINNSHKFAQFFYATHSGITTNNEVINYIEGELND